jgi:transporter family-2 protein
MSALATALSPANLTIGGFAILAGIATAFQPPINATFASHSTSRLHGGWINFVVGATVMTTVCLLARTPLPTGAKIGAAPWWAYLGGCLGAIFVTTAVFVVPKIGAVNYLVLLILGQMLANTLIDHFGWLGIAQQPFTLGKAIGLLLILAGVACVKLL